MRRGAIAPLLALALGAGVCQAQDCLEPVGRWPHGVSNSVAAQGDLALLANGAALQVVDVTDPSAPAVLGELYLAQRIEAVAISGDRGYVLTSNNLHVVDLSAPTTPSELGFLSGFIAGRGLDVVEDLVFVQGYDTLYVANVANPTSPVLSGALEWANMSVLDLAVASDHVVLTAGDDGLRVVDVSDPTSPTEVAAVDLGADTSARFLDVENGRAYVSGRGAPSDDKLFVVDLTDPNAPVIEADPVIAAGGDVVVRDGLAHIFGGYPEALHIYDVTVPQTPVWQGSAAIPSEYSERLAAIDDHVLVTTYLRGLTVVETTDPTAPAPVGRLDAPGRSSDAAYSDGVLFIAGADRGLRMVDVADPSYPVELGYTNVVPLAFGVAVRGDIANVVGTNQGLVTVDVSDPAAPVILGNAPGADGEWVTLAGDHAYVVNPRFGVYVVDVSTPAQPVQVGTLDLPSGTGEWWEWPVVSGGHLFVRNNHNDPSVAIIDVGDPTAPVLVGSIDVNANVAGLAVTGSWLLVPDFDAEPEVRIFDVTNPVAPVERDPYLPVGGYAEVVGVSGSVAYMSLWTGSYPDYEFAVEAVNFADPGAPEFMGLSHVSGPVRRLPTGPGQVFAVTLETGFGTFTLCQGPIFADDFESGGTGAWTSAVP